MAHEADNMREAVRQPEPQLNKKRTILLLRSVVIFTTAYLILGGPHAVSPGNLAYVALLVVSNFALAFAPSRLFEARQFAPSLLLGDTALVLMGLYQTAGFSQEFLIIYFFTLFLTTTTETVGQIAIGAGLISGLYGYWLWLSTDTSLDASLWLRLPFFFVVAIFYAFLTGELKLEKRRREEAERERTHLRWLLQVAGSMSQTAVTDECLREIGAVIEAALPNLRCELFADAVAHPPPSALCVPIKAYEEQFGFLVIRSTTGVVTDNERALCQLVIQAVASALYTTRQVETAQQAGRIKEEFIATLSHELRTPLHAILGYSDLIESVLDSSVDPVISESVDRLRANAQRLHDLLEQMLGFAMLRAGHATPHVARVSLSDLLAELASTTSALLVGRPIQFQLDAPVSLPSIFTDGPKLRQALRCLLNNAAKFTEAGTVRLAAAFPAPDQLVITVSDTGIGMAADDVAVIFEGFRQVDGSSTRRFGGVGLGLTLARGLIGALGGTLDVSSRPSEGTTFQVALPLGGPGGENGLVSDGARTDAVTAPVDGANGTGVATAVTACG